MTFRVGMKVECYRDALEFHEGEPAIGDRATVSNVYVVEGVLMLELFEFPSPDTDEYYAGWEAEYFRPLTDSKTEVSFTAGADPDSEQYDNRRRIPVSEWGCSA